MVTPEVRANAFAKWDTNHDGFLTLDEYLAGLKGQDNLEARFKSFDKNGDGKLTREEFVGPGLK
jgi:Ca2+-binding EF-hand superfamily protein